MKWQSGNIASWYNLLYLLSFLGESSSVHNALIGIPFLIIVIVSSLCSYVRKRNRSMVKDHTYERIRGHSLVYSIIRLLCCCIAFDSARRRTKVTTTGNHNKMSDSREHGLPKSPSASSTNMTSQDNSKKDSFPEQNSQIHRTDSTSKVHENGPSQAGEIAINNPKDLEESTDDHCDPKPPKKANGYYALARFSSFDSDDANPRTIPKEEIQKDERLEHFLSQIYAHSSNALSSPNSNENFPPFYVDGQANENDCSGYFTFSISEDDLISNIHCYVFRNGKIYMEYFSISSLNNARSYYQTPDLLRSIANCQSYPLEHEKIDETEHNSENCQSESQNNSINGSYTSGSFNTLASYYPIENRPE